MSIGKAEQKWVILLENRIGPCEEWVTLIPRTFLADGDWYFVASERIAVPQAHVFDTPQQAALATIADNNQKIAWLKVQNERLQEYHDNLEAEKVKRDEQRAKEAGLTDEIHDDKSV